MRLVPSLQDGKIKLMGEFDIAAKVFGVAGYVLVAAFFACQTLREQLRRSGKVTLAGLLGFILCLLWPLAVLLVLAAIHCRSFGTARSGRSRSVIVRWF